MEPLTERTCDMTTLDRYPPCTLCGKSITWHSDTGYMFDIDIRLEQGERGALSGGNVRVPVAFCHPCFRKHDHVSLALEKLLTCPATTLEDGKD